MKSFQFLVTGDRYTLSALPLVETVSQVTARPWPGALLSVIAAARSQAQGGITSKFPVPARGRFKALT